MEIQTKYKVAIVVVALGTSFAAGRYTVSEKIKIETKVVEVEKKVQDAKKDRHRKIVIVSTVKPDGTKETTQTIVDDTATDKKTTTGTQITDGESSSIVKGDSKVTISALGGINVLDGKFTYGASVQKPILGPVTVGIWGLSNGSCGASVGLSF